MVKGKGNKKVRKSHRAPVNVPSGKEDDVDSTDENGLLDPEDLEYFQDCGRSFAFLQEVAAK